uniref:CSON012636 protein n=1 Tax=Culicoides sonorensis TaxID=179676 RepID=A0A336MBA3_CULSO
MTSAVDEARNLSSTLRRNEKAIGKKISRALSSPQLTATDNINPNQSDSYEEILLEDNNNTNNNFNNNHRSSFRPSNNHNGNTNNGRDNKSYMSRDRIHSFSVSTTTSGSTASTSSSTSTAYHENGACCAQLSEQQQQLHHTHVHCQHHHSHKQGLDQIDSNESDDNNFINTVVDNCCVGNYATLNLDDQEIEKYFVNISSNFSRNSSIRRSVRNFNKSSTGTGSGTSRRTTPASSNRASPYIFDQLSNTVTCLKPKRATYYSDTSYSSMSSRNSTLTRNRSNTGSSASVNDANKTKPFMNIDNLTYYDTQQREQQQQQQSQGNGVNRQVPDLKWNFLSDLRKEKEKRERERRKSDVSQMGQSQTLHRRKKDEYWKLRQSAQNVNNISIWCAENDERNAIIFHHESEVVENCCGNVSVLHQYLNPHAKSSEVLNNTLEVQSKTSGSLQNMQHNVFSRSVSNVYNITDEFKVFEKQSNLTRDSINLSHNYLQSSLSSSHSSLYNTTGNHLVNHNLNKVLNTSRVTSNNANANTSNRTLNVENNLSINLPTIQYEKPSHLQNLTAQNQFNREEMEIDNGYFMQNEQNQMIYSSSTEAMLSNPSNNQNSWRRSLHDPIGIGSIFRTIRNGARRILKNSDLNKKNRKNF